MREATTLFALPARTPGPHEECWLIKLKGACLYLDGKTGNWVPLDRATQFTYTCALARARGIKPWACKVVRGR